MIDHKLLFLLFVFSVIPFRSFSQNPYEPAKVGYAIVFDSSRWLPLERQRISHRKTHFYFEGKDSDVQLSERDTIKLIIRTMDNTVEFDTGIRIYKLSKKNSIDQRTIPITKDNPFGPNEKISVRMINYDKLENVKFLSQPFGKFSFIVKLPSLEPGSYVVKYRRDEFDWSLFDIIPIE